jgi:hypothetical protein
MGMKRLVSSNKDMFSAKKLAELLSLLDRLIIEEYEKLGSKSVI